MEPSRGCKSILKAGIGDQHRGWCQHGNSRLAQYSQVNTEVILRVNVESRQNEQLMQENQRDITNHQAGA